MGILDFLGIRGGTGSVDPNAPAAPAAPQSFNDRLMNPLTQVGLQLIANHGTPASQGAFSGVPEALTRAAVARKKEDKENKTLTWLKDNDPEVYSYVQAGMDPGDGFKLSLQRQQFDREMALKQSQLSAPTADIQNWNYARENPEYMDYLTRKSGGVGGRAPSGYQFTPDGLGLEPIPGGPADTSGGGGREKPPSGFRWTQDGASLEPIPGGPGEQIGGENAGRIGIAQSFLQDLPSIRQEVQKGGVTGIVDANVGRLGFGDQGRLYARIESGADALQRMLSGAGMPESEAQAYARRYMPTPSDTAEIVAQKLNQLERELGNQMGVVLRGRGGFTPAQGGASNSSDPLGLR